MVHLCSVWLGLLLLVVSGHRDAEAAKIATEPMKRLDDEFKASIQELFYRQQELAGALAPQVTTQIDFERLNAFKQISAQATAIELVQFAVRRRSLELANEMLSVRSKKKLLAANYLPELLLERLTLRGLVDGYNQAAHIWNRLYLMVYHYAHPNVNDMILQLVRTIFLRRHEYSSLATQSNLRQGNILRAYVGELGLQEDDAPEILEQLDQLIDEAAGKAGNANQAQQQIRPLFDSLSLPNLLTKKVEKMLLEQVQEIESKADPYTKNFTPDELSRVKQEDIERLQEVFAKL